MTVWRSNLSKSVYLLEDPAHVFTGNWWKEEDPVFMGRVAHACKVLGITTFKANSAYRSHAQQEAAYADFLAGKLPSAAKPGTSWHEFRLALDTSTQPLRGMTDLQVRKFGLCKPIKSEGWHFQPIETLGASSKSALAPVNLSAGVTARFNITSVELAYLENFAFAEALFTKLLNGDRGFSPATLEYIKAKPGLAAKLGI